MLAAVLLTRASLVCLCGSVFVCVCVFVVVVVVVVERHIECFMACFAWL